uniref:Uncharacterized protein n=1 Tax=viral metagenome TaxID=1070528 RepID=A0A6C0BBR5_9ZZZZ
MTEHLVALAAQMAHLIGIRNHLEEQYANTYSSILRILKYNNDNEAYIYETEPMSVDDDVNHFNHIVNLLNRVYWEIDEVYKKIWEKGFEEEKTEEDAKKED